MSTQPTLQDKMEQAVIAKNLIQTLSLRNVVEICENTAQQAISEALAEKEKKIRELYDEVNVWWDGYGFSRNTIGADICREFAIKMKELGLIPKQS